MDCVEMVRAAANEGDKKMAMCFRSAVGRLFKVMIDNERVRWAMI
jgi:hypothetical protein